MNVWKEFENQKDYGVFSDGWDGYLLAVIVCQ